MSFNPGGGSNSSLSSGTDVALSSPLDDEVLTYDTTIAKWTNKQVPASGGAYVQVVPYGTTDAQIAAMNLPAGAVIVELDQPVTNVLLNPSFEIDTTNWTLATGTGTVSRVEALDAPDGGAYVVISSTGTTTMRYNSETKSSGPGDVWSAGVWVRTYAGTGRVVQCEIQFLDSTGAQISAQTNSNPLTTTANWQHAIATNKTAPAGTVSVRMRPTLVTPQAGDAIAIDSMQLEPSATLPVYNPVSA
jgi:hypothetical protein